MTLQCWLAMLERYYPRDDRRAGAVTALDLALNEQGSFQVVMRDPDVERTPVTVSVSGPEAWMVRLHRVGYVPDPLFDDNRVVWRDGETHAFWVTARPGEQR